MIKKLWLAERIITYEGNDIIGVFTRKEKAIGACQTYDNGFTIEPYMALNFQEHQTSEKHPIVFLAYGIFQYCVREIEVNKALMP